MRFLASATLLAALLTACTEEDTDTSDTETSDTESDSEAAPEAPVEARAWWEFGMADPVLDEVSLYYLGQSWFQATDVAEVLETMGRVDREDPLSWEVEWNITADRLATLGADSEQAGHDLTAAHAYLRAATYYRAALHRDMDPRAPETAVQAQKAVDAFERYLELSGSPCEPVAMPYENTTLPGYFCPAEPGSGPAPTLIFHEGKDGWAEDGKFIVDEAHKRGINVLLFDGPGIGKTIRTQGLPFRHDWEAVITPVVDWVLQQPEVDDTRVGLYAVSLGGYLAPRAAAFEHRLSALVVNPGVVEWASVYEMELGYIDPDLPALLDADPEAFNAAIDQVMQHSDFLRWGMEDSMWHHGAQTPAELMFEIRRFDNTDLIDDITAKTLVLDAEWETRGQARDFYDQLTSEKDYLLFTEAEAAQFHVQPGATAMHAHRVFDWLDENL